MLKNALQQKRLKQKQKLLLKRKQKRLSLPKLLSELMTQTKSFTLLQTLKSGPQSAFFLCKNEIQVCYAKPQRLNDVATQQKFRSWLSASELNILKAFRFEHDRLTYLVAHGLLRATLARHTGINPAHIEFQTNPFHKPYISAPLEALDLHFNLSHTAGIVALALTKLGPVGVDVESTHPAKNVSDIAKEILTPNEYVNLMQHNNADRHACLIKYWTLKEAFVKATGIGLTYGLQTFEFDLDAQPQPLIRFLSPTDTHASDWKFQQITLTSGHILAIASHLPDQPNISISFKEADWLTEFANLS